MSETKIVKGFKVFNPDWSCRGKQYACPSKFEEDVNPSTCSKGMHFCKKAADCFNYYSFDCENRAAEVIAYGDIAEDGDKCCTNKLEIVREIPWFELLEIVNPGKNNIGHHNVGNYNIGDYNTGDHNCGDGNLGSINRGNDNTGNYNSGDSNRGNNNAGNGNIGHDNAGNYNIGDWNRGSYNAGNENNGNNNRGDRNNGNANSGWHNVGDGNSGYMNNGHRNSGHHNIGNFNTGHANIGSYNSGHHNIGDYNSGNFNIGCFNTANRKNSSQGIYLFNKPSKWAPQAWYSSQAWYLLAKFPGDAFEYIPFDDMTGEEKAEHPDAKKKDGYTKHIDNTQKRQKRWNDFKLKEKQTIMSLPNFDKEIFGQITGIDVDAG